MKRFILIAIMIALAITPASAYFTNYSYWQGSTKYPGDTVYFSADASQTCRAMGYSTGAATGYTTTTFIHIHNWSGGKNWYTEPQEIFTSVGNNSYVLPTTPAPYEGVTLAVLCKAPASQVNFDFWNYSRTIDHPNANFNGAPVAGASPLTVTFTDISNQSSSNTWRKWNFGDGTIDNTSVSPITHTYTSPGTYSVRLDVWSSEYGYFNTTKSEYITVIDASNYHLLHHVKNSESGVSIDGATIGLKNTTSGKWVYSTATTGYNEWTADADNIPLGQNQTIELYAAKTGYGSVNQTITIPYDFYIHYSFILPSSVVNATGTGTLVVTAVKNSDGTPLPDVAIILDDNQLGMTNSAGATTMRNVTAGSRVLQASLSGYQSLEKSCSITEGQTTMVIVDLVKNGETPVTTYVSPETTDYLVDTDGDGVPDTASSIVGNYTPGQLNQAAASGLMGMIGLIIQLWPLIILLILLKLIKVI